MRIRVLHDIRVSKKEERRRMDYMREHLPTPVPISKQVQVQARDYKQCARCKMLKPLVEFRISFDTLDRLSTECILCLCYPVYPTRRSIRAAHMQAAREIQQRKEAQQCSIQTK